MAKELVCGIMRDLEQEERDYRRKWSEVAKAGEYAKEAEIGRVCARFELESDEFMTARAKAIAIIGKP